MGAKRKERVTAVDYDKIPNPGSITFRMESMGAIQNAQSYVYRVAQRRGDNVTTSSDSKAKTFTINKLGKL